MKGTQESLSTVVVKHGQPARDSHSTTGSHLASWPTATAGDAKSAGSRNLPGSNAHPGTSLTDAVVRAPLKMQSSSGKLNPRWVETLMGLPVGWTMPDCASPATIAPTNCDCSATGSSPQPPPVPSLFCLTD